MVVFRDVVGVRLVRNIAVLLVGDPTCRDSRGVVSRSWVRRPTVGEFVSYPRDSKGACSKVGWQELRRPGYRGERASAPCVWGPTA